MPEAMSFRLQHIAHTDVLLFSHLPLKIDRYFFLSRLSTEKERKKAKYKNLKMEDWIEQVTEDEKGEINEAVEQFTSSQLDG